LQDARSLFVGNLKHKLRHGVSVERLLAARHLIDGSQPDRKDGFSCHSTRNLSTAKSLQGTAIKARINTKVTFKTE